MRKPTSRRRPSRPRTDDKAKTIGRIQIAVVALLVLVGGGIFYAVAKGNKALDDNLCPATPTSVTVLLVDVTDPLTVAQRQDFQNQLIRLRNAVPRFGKLVVAKVDSASDDLLKPVIVRCNPGTAQDVSELTGNPGGLQEQHEKGFVEPLDRAFAGLASASGAEASPIFESVQSVALTELLTPSATELPRKLVLVSDLLQNTGGMSFYSSLPSSEAFLSSPEFRRVRTDLRDIEVEIWMLERADAPHTQPRALIDLWDAAITRQGGTVVRAYNVSG